MWKGNGEKLYYTGESLAGETTIQKIMLVLHPFSREVLLISNKNDYTWAKQMLRTRLEVAGILTRETDSNPKNNKEIWRSITNMLFNIGDIICGNNSQNFLKGYFGFNTMDNQLNNFTKDRGEFIKDEDRPK